MMDEEINFYELHAPDLTPSSHNLSSESMVPLTYLSFLLSVTIFFKVSHLIMSFLFPIFTN